MTLTRNLNTPINYLIVFRKDKVKSRYWLFYSRTLKFVTDELKATGKTTDLESLLNDGPLERYEMQHLVETHPKILKLYKKFSDKYLRFTRIFASFSKIHKNIRSFSNAIA